MIKELLNSFESFGITSTQVKIFLFSFLAVTIMVTLQKLGVHSPIQFFQ